MTTHLYLGRVGWNNKYTHVVDFETQTKQREWFEANFTSGYQGQTRVLKRDSEPIELNIDYATFIQNNYNYIWVKEVNGENVYQWFAFVTAVTRNNSNTAIINYEVDYWQTYHFTKDGVKAVTDIKDAFVQREHQDRWKVTVDDIEPIFSRTIENLETGDMVSVEQKTVRQYLRDKTTGQTYNIYVNPYLVIFNENVDVSVKLNNVEAILENQSTIINGVQTPQFSYLIYFTFEQADVTKGDAPYDLEIDLLGTPYYYGSFRLAQTYYNGEPTTYRKLLQLNAGSRGDDYLGNAITNLKTNNPKVLSVKKLTHLPFELTATFDSVATIYIDLNTQYSKMLKPVKVHSEGGTDLFALLLNSITLRDYLDVYSLPRHTLDALPTINTNVNIKYEPKLLTQEFTNYKINSSKSDTLTLLNENLNNNTYIGVTNTYDMFSFDELVVANYNDNDYNFRVRTQNTNELILSNDKYIEYMLNNRNQIAVNQTLNGVQVVTGIASLVAGGGLMGADKLGMGLGLVAGGIHQKTAGVGGLVSEMARQNDYKNKVDDIKTNLNTLNLDMKTSGDYYRLTKYEIRPVYKDKIWKLLMKQGYSTNEYKVPNLFSRYYYNFIKCSYIDLNPNTIGEDAVRNIIENIYANGVTLWHYRNSSTFRFMDYAKENVEMSLL